MIRNKKTKEADNDFFDDNVSISSNEIVDLNSSNQDMQTVVAAMLRDPTSNVSKKAPETASQQGKLTPTKPQFNTNKRTMDTTDVLTEGHPVTALAVITNSTTTSNSALEIPEVEDESPGPTFYNGSHSEQKKKMPAYVPVEVVFTKEFWPTFDHNLQHLHLDLLWPKAGSETRDGEAFPLEDLEPLCEFRQLRSLKLTGMLDSYQKYIWQAAWLNPNLEELALEMCLEPSIRSDHSKDWPTIKGNWRMKRLTDIKSDY